MESALFILSGNILPVKDLTYRFTLSALLYFSISIDLVLVKAHPSLSNSALRVSGKHLVSLFRVQVFSFWFYPFWFLRFNSQHGSRSPSSHLISEIMPVTGPDNDRHLLSLTETFILKNYAHPSATARRTQWPKSLIPWEGILNVVTIHAEPTFTPWNY